jgi:hypothetical protein
MARDVQNALIIQKQASCVSITEGGSVRIVLGADTCHRNSHVVLRLPQVTPVSLEPSNLADLMAQDASHQMHRSGTLHKQQNASTCWERHLFQQCCASGPPVVEWTRLSVVGELR